MFYKVLHSGFKMNMINANVDNYRQHRKKLSTSYILLFKGDSINYFLNDHQYIDFCRSENTQFAYRQKQASEAGSSVGSSSSPSTSLR